MKNLSHFDEKSQSFWPSQVGRYALVTGPQGRFADIEDSLSTLTQ